MRLVVPVLVLGGGTLARAHAQQPLFPIQFVDSLVGQPSAQPIAAIEADFDQDGRSELSICGGLATFAGYLQIFRRTALPPYLEAAFVHHPTMSIDRVAVGDLNGDGDPDLVCGKTPAPGVNIVRVFPGIAGYGFGAGLAVDTAGAPLGLFAADFDADAQNELALVTTAPNQIALSQPDGQGAFMPATMTALPATPTSCASADLNGDGRTDLVLGSSVVLSALATSADRFALLTAPALATGSRQVDVSDFDADGDIDVLAHSFGAGFSVLENDGSGALTLRAITPTSSAIRRLTPLRLDDDARADVALIDSTGVRLEFLRSQGDGSFASTSSLSLVALPTLIDGFDADGDGRDELLASWKAEDGFACVRFDAAGKPLGSETVDVGFERPLSLADRNADGEPDLLATDAYGGVALYYGQPNGPVGPFALPLVYPSSTSATDTVSRAVDLNADGEEDVVTLLRAALSPTEPGAVVVRLGNADGSLASPSIHDGASHEAEQLLLGDANGDGMLDVVAIHANASAAYTFLGDGGGGLHTPIASRFEHGGIAAEDLTDLDADGRGDLLRGTSNPFMPGYELHAHPATALGGFGAPSLVLPLPLRQPKPFQIRAADLDLDGRADVVALQPGLLSVFRASGPLAFDAPHTYACALSSAFRVGDVSGDAKLDLVLNGGPASRVLLGHGDGAFHMQQRVLGLSSAADALLVDANGDGRLDLVTPGVTIHSNLADAKFGATAFGGGTPGCAGAHELGANGAPTVGNAGFALTWNHAPPNVPGLCALGFDAASALLPGVAAFGLGVELHVDPLAPAGVLLFTIAGTPSGVGSFPAPIANDVSLIGQVLALQLVWPWPLGPCAPSQPFGLSSSNGLGIALLP